ncbi:MAG TPA: Wzz/FepE/Etk N-terminal domain-containing protein [Acidimicrobiales bacterium]|nr:Wzz/FepE/Etk N-terminal domain-containing protein [Acidimicrobiales bacterium]
MENSQPLRVIWGARWWIIAFAIVAGGAAYGLSTLLPKSYQAAAQTQIISGAQAAGQYIDPTSLTQLTNIYDQQANTKVVAGQAAHALNRPGVNATTLRKHISITVQLDSQGITFTGTAADPNTAANYANAYARAFATYVASAQASERAQELSQTEDQISRIESQLSDLISSTSPTAVALTTELQALQSQAAQVQSRPGDSIDVIQPASAPTTPSSPKPKIDAVLAFLAALVLASAAAYGRSRITDRFDSADATVVELGMPKLGEVPRGASTGDSAVVEAFRVLRTTLEFALRDKPNPTVLVTSAGPGSGKTYLVANLSRAMAAGEHRVLAVDADLRRPSLHETFGLPLEPGLGDLLLRTSPIASFPGSEPTPNTPSLDRWGHLQVLAAGRVVADPVTALSSRQMEQVVDQLRRSHDILIIDSSPTAVADPVVLSREVDAVIIVVDLRRDRRAAVRDCVATLRAVDAPILGCVINSAGTGPRGYPYYHRGSRQPAAPATEQVS